jgi:hypothetical protein
MVVEGRISVLEGNMKKYFIIIICIAVLMVPVITVAGTISDTFGDGVFGLEWGSSIEKVKQAFPGGKLDESFILKSYAVKDSRTLFGYERNESDEISFGFDLEGRLNGVTVHFKDTTKNAGLFVFILNTYFGRGVTSSAIGKTMQTKWDNDNGTTLTVNQDLKFSGKAKFSLTIFNRAYLKDFPVKSELGF